MQHLRRAASPSARHVHSPVLRCMAHSAAMDVPLMASSVAIVGGGITGTAAAVELTRRSANVRVDIFDLGRFQSGGRLASQVSRAPGQPQYDKGAQAICGEPKSAAFQRVLEGWERSGLVAPWPGAAGAWVDCTLMAAATGNVGCSSRYIEPLFPKRPSTCRHIGLCHRYH
jgi:hypothetical protein